MADASAGDAPQERCCGLAAYIPLFLVFMSGFGFSIQGLIIKILEEHGFSASFELIVIRGIIQSCVSYAIIEYNRRGGETAQLFGENNYSRFILGLRAVFGWGGISFGFLAIEHLPIADASVLLMQSPVLAAVLSYLILGEPWRLPEFCSTLVSMTGVVLIARPHFIFDHISSVDADDDGKYDSLGPLFGLLAALSAGSAFVMVRLLGTSAKMPWANVGFATSLAQCLLSIPLVFLSGQKFDMSLGLFEWSLLLFGGVVGTVSQLAMTIGMQREKSASASAMRTSDVLFAFIWQILFTSDPVTAMSIVGAVLVMTGVMIIVGFKSKSIPEEDISNQSINEQSLSNNLETIPMDGGTITSGNSPLSTLDYVLEWVWARFSSSSDDSRTHSSLREIAMSKIRSSNGKYERKSSNVKYSRVDDADEGENSNI
jgi:drug/metabolite transporter (DMT)-like permease